MAIECINNSLRCYIDIVARPLCYYCVGDKTIKHLFVLLSEATVTQMPLAVRMRATRLSSVRVRRHLQDARCDKNSDLASTHTPILCMMTQSIQSVLHGSWNVR